jgi:protein-disulfide isomerase
LAAAPAWTLLKPIPPVPEVVKSFWQPGKITVVEVTDFDCPYCRETHPALREFLAELGDRARFVRFVMPLATHANARPAARAHFAAEAQGKAAEVAVALFAAEDLTPAGCEKVARSLGLAMEKYRAAVADAATDAAIDARAAWVDQGKMPGLPVIWVQDQRLVGVQTADSLRAALGRAERRRDAGIDASP